MRRSICSGTGCRSRCLLRPKEKAGESQSTPQCPRPKISMTARVVRELTAEKSLSAEDRLWFWSRNKDFLTREDHQMALDILSAVEAKTARIALTGELDGSAAPALRETVDKVLSGKPTQLVLQVERLSLWLLPGCASSFSLSRSSPT